MNISVYLQKKDIKTGKPFCQIEYKTLENDCTYDIKHNKEAYHLFLDGKEIEMQ